MKHTKLRMKGGNDNNEPGHWYIGEYISFFLGIPITILIVIFVIYMLATKNNL